MIDEIAEIACSIYDNLIGFAFKKTNDLTLSEDIVQLSYVKFFKSIDRFEIKNINLEESIKGLLFTITRNNIASEGRLKYKKNLIHLDLVEETNINCPNDIQYHHVELKQTLDIINEMPKKYKEVFMLFAYGNTLQEISDELKIPLGTVKNRMFKGRKLLLKKLGEE